MLVAGSTTGVSTMYYFQPVSPVGCLTVMATCGRQLALPMVAQMVAVQVGPLPGCTSRYVGRVVVHVVVRRLDSGRLDLDLCFVDVQSARAKMATDCYLNLCNYA